MLAEEPDLWRFYGFLTCMLKCTCWTSTSGMEKADTSYITTTHTKLCTLSYKTEGEKKKTVCDLLLNCVCGLVPVCSLSLSLQLCISFSHTNTHTHTHTILVMCALWKYVDTITYQNTKMRGWIGRLLDRNKAQKRRKLCYQMRELPLWQLSTLPACD